jgi:hypothetical protein
MSDRKNGLCESFNGRLGMIASMEIIGSLDVNLLSLAVPAT